MTSEQEEALRAKVRKQYEMTKASVAKLTQHRSGETFQHELDVTHQSLLNRRHGAIYRHAKETVGAPPGGPDRPGTLRFKKGGNPVDYTGHLNYHYLNGNWFPCVPTTPGARACPIAFDAKRESTALSYHSREAEQKRQLLDLREASAAGAWAFLLVHCVAVESVFIIHRPEYFQTLLAGGTVRLVESGSRTKLLPFAAWSNASGWGYPALLPALFGLDSLRHPGAALAGS